MSEELRPVLPPLDAALDRVIARRRRDLREAKVHAICAAIHQMLEQAGLSLTIPTVMRAAEAGLSAVERISVEGAAEIARLRGRAVVLDEEEPEEGW